MRSRLSSYNTHRIESVLDGVAYPKRSFTAQPDFLRQCKMFITEDEVDHFFLSGSIDSRLSVYAHFCYPHTPKEQQAFIKSHYGEYSGGGRYGYNHTETHKGLTYQRKYGSMESKRLGLCQKSLFVVPNHLTEQWASDFLQLYPAANILVSTRKDFEKKNRKKFCGRIATGDYDAVIIGHSQFEKIPISGERQQAILKKQMYEILLGIDEAKRDKAENFTIKQMEKTRKGLQLKLDELNDQSRKDDVVTFEELGVDRIFVDESHYFKNLFLYTKMHNVGGIAQTEAQKSSDLFMKCRYLDELTGGRGIVFATGTPISNSMVFTTDGRWFWNSHSLKGRAIEFIMAYEDKTLPEAVLILNHVHILYWDNGKEPRQEFVNKDRFEQISERVRTTFSRAVYFEKELKTVQEEQTETVKAVRLQLSAM